MKNNGRLKGRWAYHFDKCIDCGTTDRKHSQKGRCEYCYSKTRREYQKKWRQKNIKKLRKHWKKYHLKNRERDLLKQKERYYSAKDKAMKIYGNKCSCCGETQLEFLTIDHINNDGADHRKKIRGKNIVFWLKDNNYPKGFQILCWNCNLAKGIYGKCPHKQ